MPLRPPLYKNLFSLKFETGYYFLKSIKKRGKSTLRILLNMGDIGAYHTNWNINANAMFKKKIVMNAITN